MTRRSISKALKSVPDIREKEVARARSLIRRKEYPSDRILRRVAQRILDGRRGD